MNLKSEQLDIDLNIVIDVDQPLNIVSQNELLFQILGKENCEIKKINDRNVFVYTNDKGRKIILLKKTITYLGGNGQHPVYKKRMQLPSWYKEIVYYCQQNKEYEVKFLGIYHYEGNIVFTEFIKDTYITKKMNNSAAHVYINDLYQASVNGLFHKIDSFNNHIVTINIDVLKEYLNESLEIRDDLFSVIEDFNAQFPFDQWITAQYAIDYMYESGFSQWRQTEWAGWYLECMFDQFIKERKIEHIVEYVGLIGKAQTDLDFDLLINESFYGDLKASSNTTNSVLLNDQTNLITAIETYDKFWYIIYSHETRKDKDFEDFPMTQYRAYKIQEENANKDKDFDPYSYHNKMKHSVNFKNVIILELNKVNYKHALEDFNQGVQPDGNPRNPKFKISKKNIDNFIVYKYTSK
ncbi:MAG: hypothetical protein AB7E61_00440 [Acholeplasmataceae bacterium]